MDISWIGVYNENKSFDEYNHVKKVKMLKISKTGVEIIETF